jgi:hypothetical protein
MSTDTLDRVWPSLTWIPERQREFFPYTAHALWPGTQEVDPTIPAAYIQVDWVDSVLTMERWLETAVGHRYNSWVWAEYLGLSSWHCGVAFHWERDRTLFLIKWS